MFRKSREDPTDESISEDMLASVPEMRRPEALSEAAAAHAAREAIDRLLEAFASTADRMRTLEEENLRLASDLRDARAKAAVLDEVRASLNRLP